MVEQGATLYNNNNYYYYCTRLSSWPANEKCDNRIIILTTQVQKAMNSKIARLRVFYIVGHPGESSDTMDCNIYCM